MFVSKSANESLASNCTCSPRFFKVPTLVNIFKMGTFFKVAHLLISSVDYFWDNNKLERIIITLFKSQIILAEHECSTNWGDCKSNQMLVFEERGKPEYPEKNLLEQSREQTNSAHLWRRVGIKPGTHWWKASALTTAPTLLPIITKVAAQLLVSPL